MGEWLERAARVAHECEQDILSKFPNTVAGRSSDGKGLSHALSMARAIQGSKEIDSDTKACRWLGYVQCIMVYEGVETLERAKHRNLSSKESK